MARIFITGSADGLGRMAAELLLSQGHQVVLHARNQQRADDTRKRVPNAEAIITGDLSSLHEIHSVADQGNKLGPFDAIIHNAAVGYQEPRRIVTADGLAQVFAVNTLAPYMLTALIERPKRLVYLSSGLHKGGDGNLHDLNWEHRPWQGTQAYSDTKLHDVLLAFAVARLWPGTLANALEPGWVPTRMGGRNAPDDLQKGCETQAWLAVSNDPEATVSGEYFYHQKRRAPAPVTRDLQRQDQLLEACRQMSGVSLPG